jgi:hypothetical protein
MADDTPLKSAYELAMERLRRQDRKAGVKARKPLSRAQKEKIARLRKQAEAKLAELEIMYRKDLAATGGDPEKIRELNEHLETDRGRVESSTEAAVEKVRNEGD